MILALDVGASPAQPDRIFGPYRHVLGPNLTSRTELHAGQPSRERPHGCSSCQQCIRIPENINLVSKQVLYFILRLNRIINRFFRWQLSKGSGIRDFRIGFIQYLPFTPTCQPGHEMLKKSP
jgi:hypothetical protein